MGDNAIGTGTNQTGKRGGDAAGGLAVSAGLGAGGASATGGEVAVATGIGVGVGGTADASGNGGDAGDNSYIGVITINA